MRNGAFRAANPFVLRFGKSKLVVCAETSFFFHSLVSGFDETKTITSCSTGIPSSEKNGFRMERIPVNGVRVKHQKTQVQRLSITR